MSKDVNYRKNIMKAYHQEVHRLNRLKNADCAYYDEESYRDYCEDIVVSEAKISLLKDLQEPLKKWY